MILLDGVFRQVLLVTYSEEYELLGVSFISFVNMVFTRFLIHRSISKISIIRYLNVMLHGGSKWSFVDVGVLFC